MNRPFVIAFFALATLVGGCANRIEALHERPEIRKFTGFNAFEHIEGRSRRDCFALHYAQLFANYGEQVEFQLTRELIILDKRNVETLYGTRMIPVPRYRRGSRPVLEKTLAPYLKPEMTQQQTALAIMRCCRDLHRLDPGRKWNDWIFGGTEEELIERGERLCEVMARLFVGLCEVEGIPARIVSHIVGGHYAAETYVDGHWMYIDPRFGVYFLHPDGKGASLLELLSDAKIIDRQTESVKADVVEYATWEKRAARCKDVFFSSSEINGFAYYSLADAPRYSYDTTSFAEAERNGLELYNAMYVKAIKAVLDEHDAVTKAE